MSYRRDREERAAPLATGKRWPRYQISVPGRPPAQTDMQRFFRVTPPKVHRMVKQLETLGLLARQPGKARALRVLLPEDELPRLVRPN